jgi:hypothetical protein
LAHGLDYPVSGLQLHTCNQLRAQQNTFDRRVRAQAIKCVLVNYVPLGKLIETHIILVVIENSLVARKVKTEAPPELAAEIKYRERPCS